MISAMRRPLVPAVALAISGCELVFPVATTGIDAPPPDCDNTLDEDSDGVFDCDDVCPGEADNQQDTDGDGIGDACDPHRNDPTDYVVRRTFFYAGRELDGWVPNPDWMPCAGCVQTASLDAPSQPLMATPPLGYTDEITVEIGVVLGGLGAASPNRIGVWLDGASSLVGKHACVLEEIDMIPAVIPLVMYADENAQSSTPAPVDFTVFPVRAVFQFTRRSMPQKELDCEVQTPTARVMPPGPLIPVDTTPTGSFGIEGFHAAVEAHHVIVYAQPNQ
jgi:hypothetical protein